MHHAASKSADRRRTWAAVAVVAICAQLPAHTTHAQATSAPAQALSKVQTLSNTQGLASRGAVTGSICAPASVAAAEPRWWETVSVEAVDAAGAVVATSTLDENGNFLLGALPSGAYRVRAAAVDVFGPDGGLDISAPNVARVYFPGVGAASDARRVAVVGGERTELGPMLLPEGGAILGSVAFTGVTGAQPGVVAIAEAPDGTVLASARVASDGSFLITQIAPGTVRVRFADDDSGGLLEGGTQFYPGSPSSADATPIAVRAGADVRAVDITLGASSFTTYARPRVSGPLGVGSTLTAEVGSWSPRPAFAFQWVRDGVPIAGATSATYRLTSADLGASIAVRATSTRSGYSTLVLTSTGSVPVLRGFTQVPIPGISGEAAIGSRLTAMAGTWKATPTTMRYQWFRNGTAIPGATARTYTPGLADLGAAVRVRVISARSGYLTTHETSDGVIIRRTFAAAPRPTISGAARVGNTLSVKTGTWSPSASLKYQWYRNGATIAGATKSTYKLTSSDRGATITVRVTGTRTGYLATSKTSAGTRVV